MKQKPNLWVFGHTHGNVDITLGETRIVSNQRGYIPEAPSEGFDEHFIC